MYCAQRRCPWFILQLNIVLLYCLTLNPPTKFHENIGIFLIDLQKLYSIYKIQLIKPIKIL